jgi:hypothetical protein
MTKDYGIIMQDKNGRRTTLAINGASIDELVATGSSREDATESVEGNTFQNAIARGEIGDDAWMVSYVH